MRYIVPEFHRGAFGEGAVFEADRHFTYSKQRVMLPKSLLKTTENTWSEGILKTIEVLEVRRIELVGKGCEAYPRKGFWPSL